MEYSREHGLTQPLLSIITTAYTKYIEASMTSDSSLILADFRGDKQDQRSIEHSKNVLGLLFQPFVIIFCLAYSPPKLSKYQHFIYGYANIEPQLR